MKNFSPVNESLRKGDYELFAKHPGIILQRGEARIFAVVFQATDYELFRPAVFSHQATVPIIEP